MIQLYKKGNHEYSMNGDHVIQAEQCTLDRTLNGSWELYLEVPLDKEGTFKDVVSEAVIKAPAPEGDRLFTIYDTNKISDDVMSASARPIFFNSAHDAFLMDVRPTGKNGQEALNIMTEGTQYSGKSNITTVNAAYYVRKNLMEAINSDDEQSFLNRWGGEVVYNDFEIVINDRVGGDYGVKIFYGKNMEAIQEHCNTENVTTRIIPMAYNGYMLEGDSPWVDSPLIGSYENIRYRVIKYEDVKLTEDCSEDEAGFDTIEELREELIRRCNLEYDSGIDRPKITLDVNMVDISQTVEYRDYKILETVSLGDSVNCKHAVLGIETDARVIRQKWDCIRKRNDELIIGDFQPNYFDKLSSTMKSTENAIRPDGTVIGERISGFINGAMAMLKAQYNVAKKQDVLAILFENLDEESELYGALAIGTQGVMISKTRTTDGRSWDWTTAMTANGLIANIIVTGILSDKTGTNFWNLDTGEFRLSSSGLQVDDKPINEYVDGKVGDTKILFMELSNEYQGIPTDENGNNGIFEGCYTEIKLLFGQDDVTNLTNAKFEITPSAGIVGNWDETKKRYTITDLTMDSGYVDITGTYLNISVTRRFSVAKTKNGMPGENGRVYFIEASAQILKRSQDNSIIPGTLTFSAYYRDGTSAERNAYAGRMLIQKSADGVNWTMMSSATSNTTSKTVSVSSLESNIAMVRCTLYEAGGTTNPLDVQSVTVVTDIEALTHEQIFSLLTNDGEIKGIYKEGNQLYISFTYAKGGTLTLGGPNNGRGTLQILDANGNVCGTLTNSGADFYYLVLHDRIIVYDSTSTYQVSIGFDQDTGNFYISGNAVSTTIPDLKTNKLSSEETDTGALKAGKADITGNTNIAGMLTGDNASFSTKVYAAEMQTTMMDAADGNIGTSKFTDYAGTSRRPLASYGTNGRRIAYIASRGASGSEYINVNGQFSDDASVTTYASRKISIASSDFRLKKNVLPTEIEALPLIRKIKMKQFDWIADGTHQDIGFVADLLEKLDKNLAIGGGYDEDGNMDLKVVNEFYLMGYVVKAIQELADKVDAMEG